MRKVIGGALILSMFSGCASYVPLTPEELTARKDAYVSCKTASKIDMQITDVRDAIIIKLLDKMPGNDVCAEFITSGDRAQIEIAKSNNETAQKAIGATGSAVGTVAMVLGATSIVDSVGKSAGHNVTVGRDQSGGDISYPTTTTEITEMAAE